MSRKPIKNDIRYTMLLPRELLERVRVAADREERPVAWCVRKALEEWLDKQESE